jgi:IS4 transposase
VLLRLALAYGCCGLSLRQSALWAAGDGIANLSDEALYKRLSKTGSWLGQIALSLLGGGGDGRGDGGEHRRRLRVIDGTTISAPGASRPTWRLILNFDPETQRLCGLSISPIAQGESLKHCSLGPGDLAIADRGFARAPGLAAVRAQGADFLVRLGSRSLRLFDLEGNRIELAKLLGDAGPEEIDQPVLIGDAKARACVRLVASRLPDAAADGNRLKLKRAGQQEGYEPSPAAQLTAGYLILLTSIDKAEIPAINLIALYRQRWQVELAIKRMKTLGGLDRLPAKSCELATAWLNANLIGTLLTENLAAEVLDSPPSGPARQSESRIHLAPDR